ncbi:MAG: serine/threonine protein kinase, partial [Gemmatimonadales bacterium]|nr:serine/threonine protein kinase [Gemmatimonadales bacterium]
PNLMTLLDSGSEGDLLFLVMPIATGSLRSYLQQHGAPPITQAMPILRDVITAIRHAHAEGVLHRDIKPDNVMLRDGVAMVADFGISKAMLAAQSEDMGRAITQAGVVVGTPAYMAPEQWLGDPSADHRADLFSFGCMAYEVLVGEAPFGSADAADATLRRMRSSHAVQAERLRAVAPLAVAQIVSSCLEYGPGDRPADAGVVAAALDPMARAHAPGRGFRMRALLGVLLLAAAVAWFLVAGR